MKISFNCIILPCQRSGFVIINNFYLRNLIPWEHLINLCLLLNKPDFCSPVKPSPTLFHKGNKKRAPSCPLQIHWDGPKAKIYSVGKGGTGIISKTSINYLPSRAAQSQRILAEKSAAAWGKQGRQHLCKIF